MSVRKKLLQCAPLVLVISGQPGSGRHNHKGLQTMTRATRLIIQSICGLTLIAMPFAIYAALVSGSPLLIAACGLMAMGAAILAIAADA